MPYTITWTERGVEWTYTGTVTGAEIIQSNDAIYGDPRFDDIRYQLVDLSGIEGAEVSERDMRRMAHLDAAAGRTNPNIRLAVVAPGPAARKLAEDYQTNKTLPPWEQKTFETREEAIAWLGLA